MADSDQTPDTVSREAHQRVTAERDALKADLDKASVALAAFDLRDKAAAHFRTMDGISDPYGLAAAAIDDKTLTGVSADELGDKLTSWFESRKALFGTPTSPAVDPPPAATEPALTPGIAQASPAPTGTPPPPVELLDPKGDEVQALIRGNQHAELDRLTKEGKIAWKADRSDAFSIIGRRS